VFGTGGRPGGFLAFAAANEGHTLVRNSGQPDMQGIAKQGEKIEGYDSTGDIGAGEGRKGGIAYMMMDGSMVHVPEGEGEEAGAAKSVSIPRQTRWILTRSIKRRRHSASADARFCPPQVSHSPCTTSAQSL